MLLLIIFLSAATSLAQFIAAIKACISKKEFLN
jgi:hypothetical protein